jgi:hypothetical protein
VHTIGVGLEGAQVFVETLVWVVEQLRDNFAQLALNRYVEDQFRRQRERQLRLRRRMVQPAYRRKADRGGVAAQTKHCVRRRKVGVRLDRPLTLSASKPGRGGSGTCWINPIL